MHEHHYTVMELDNINKRINSIFDKEYERLKSLCWDACRNGKSVIWFPRIYDGISNNNVPYFLHRECRYSIEGSHEEFLLDDFNRSLRFYVDRYCKYFFPEYNYLLDYKYFLQCELAK